MSSQFDDLQRLTEMRDRGDISQDEYEKLKADLLESSPGVTADDDETSEQIDAQTRWWLIGAGVLMAVGSFLPWASITFSPPPNRR